MRTHAYACVSACLSVSMHVCTHVRTSACMYACIIKWETVGKHERPVRHSHLDLSGQLKFQKPQHWTPGQHRTRLSCSRSQNPSTLDGRSRALQLVLEVPLSTSLKSGAMSSVLTLVPTKAFPMVAPKP